jgi:hypothetical protein
MIAEARTWLNGKIGRKGSQIYRLRFVMQTGSGSPTPSMCCCAFRRTGSNPLGIQDVRLRNLLPTPTSNQRL